MCTLLEQDRAFYSSVQSTRWVASQFCALNAIEKHFPATISHLQHVGAGTGIDAAKARGILKELQSLKFVKFLYQMMDIMDILSVLSQQFQRDDLFVSDILSKLELAEMRLEQLKSTPGKHTKKFLKNFDETTNTLKCGKDSNQDIKLSHASYDVNKTLHTVVCNMQDYIDLRFGKLQVPPFKCFSVFDHTSMPTARNELLRYGNEEIEALVEAYSGLLSPEEQSDAIEEWLELKLKMNSRRHLSPNDAYSGLLQSKPSDLKSILVLVNIMMTLSPSTAKLERSFSAMKSIKTNLRTKMDQSTLQLLMRINDSSMDIDTFNPKPAINHWLSAAAKPRLILHQQRSKSSKTLVPVPNVPMPCSSSAVDFEELSQ